MFSLLSVLLGSNSFGLVKKLNNQYIATSFYFFLFPFDSHFVFSVPDHGFRKIEIPLNRTSLRAYYQSMLMMLGPFILFFSLIFSGVQLSFLTSISIYAPFAIALALCAGGVYFLYTFGKSNPHETKRRIVLEEAIGLNALPEWLSEKTRMEFFEILSAQLPTNWKSLISSQQFDTALFYKLYAAIYYHKELDKCEENEYLFTLLDKRINKDLY